MRKPVVKVFRYFTLRAFQESKFWLAFGWASILQSRALVNRPLDFPRAVQKYNDTGAENYGELRPGT